MLMDDGESDDEIDLDFGLGKVKEVWNEGDSQVGNLDIDVEHYGESSSDDSIEEKKVNPKDILLQFGGAGGENNPIMGLQEEVKKKDLPNDMQPVYIDGQGIDPALIREINCTMFEKELEFAERNKKKDKLNTKLDKVMLQMETTTNPKRKELMKNEAMVIRNGLDDLEAEEMNENKFWGYQLEVDDGFQYGRDIIKEGTYENHLQLPYYNIPLLTLPNVFGGKTCQVGYFSLF